MRLCNRCHVHIENDIDLCPLCGQNTAEIDGHYELDYPTNISKKKFKYLIRLIIFLAIVAIATILTIDFVVPEHSLWAVIAMVTTLYLTITIIFAVRSHRNLGLMILANVIGFSLFMIFIDSQTGTVWWSINYLVPAVIMLGTTIITIIIVFKPMLLRDYIIYQFIIALLGVAPLIIWLLKIATVDWLIIASAVYSLLTFIGMFIFKDRRTKHELKKRFHM